MIFLVMVDDDDTTKDIDPESIQIAITAAIMDYTWKFKVHDLMKAWRERNAK